MHSLHVRLPDYYSTASPACCQLRLVPPRTNWYLTGPYPTNPNPSPPRRPLHVEKIKCPECSCRPGTPDARYDNRSGFDYHLPVEGSKERERPLHIVHIAVEMAPIAKVGGLGDVVTSLARAVQEEGHVVEVIVPSYRFFDSSPLLGSRKFEAAFDWGGTHIVVTTQEVEGLRVFFVEPRNGMFETQSVYSAYGDDVKFDFFCKAALEFLLQTKRQPDVLHCHDWSTAEVARAFWEDYQPYGLSKPNVVFTIHNLEFGQSRIGMAALHCQKFTTGAPRPSSRRPLPFPAFPLFDSLSFVTNGTERRHPVG